MARDRVVALGTCRWGRKLRHSVRAGRAGRHFRAGPAAEMTSAGVTPAEIQRMFDAYALVQAQEQLRISDDQYSRFLVRYKSAAGYPPEVAPGAHAHRRGPAASAGGAATRRGSCSKRGSRRSHDVDTRASAEVKKAYEGIDELLDLRQRASFRVFEELMERRKLELITRARQANRPRQQP